MKTSKQNGTIDRKGVNGEDQSQVHPEHSPHYGTSTLDEALRRVGLPVKCCTCGEKANILPGGDHHGWWRLRLLGKSKWYCPEDAPTIKERKDNMEVAYRTPQPVVEPETVEEELYKLLD